MTASEALARRYRRELGIPAVITLRSEQIILDASLVGAVIMPSDIGRCVRWRLARRRQLGPVIEHPRSQRWALLTDPCVDEEHPIDEVLQRMNVALAAHWIALPSVQDRRSPFRRWFYLPRNDFRPPTSVVLGVVREVGCR